MATTVVLATTTHALADESEDAEAESPAPDAGPPAGDDYHDNARLFTDGKTDLDAGSGSSDPAPVDTPTDDPTTGSVRLGIYDDSDQTTVWRLLGALAASWGLWGVSGTLSVDSVTSASVDVRSSPGLSKVDVVTGASGRTSTSGGQMSDRRVQVSASLGHDDHAGIVFHLPVTVAAETDYASVSAGARGSFDLDDRALTLLGGASVTQNWIHSVLDPSLSEQMSAFAWSAGLAFVLTPTDVLRLRYDGDAALGYQASPYRNVRFGNWTTSSGPRDQIIFANTIGSVDGLPEKLPDRRVGHAATLEWLHALADGVGVHPELRLARDSWGVASVTAAIDLRVARPGWRLQLGYRFYAQSRADFFASKYVMAPAMYEYYTSDKELGDERGHMVELGISRVIRDSQEPGDTRLLLDGRVTVLRYDYPGFLLLDSRTSAFLDVGLTWEL